MSSTPLSIEVGDVSLAAQLARPPGLARVPGLIVSHGFPAGPGGADRAANTYPALGERLCEETGWAVLTFNFRGTGESGGDFSMRGWREDLAAVADCLGGRPDVTGVWLAGSSAGGALSVCHAAEDDRVRGVATLAAPRSFRGWVASPSRFLDEVRRIGLIRSDGFPPDVSSWAREVDEVDPLAVAAKIPPRPLFVIHGSDDDIVPTADAQAYAAAAGPNTEVRIVPSAGHRLRHDPRVVAMLIGWLSRQER